MASYIVSFRHLDPTKDARLQVEIGRIASTLPDGDVVEEDGRNVVRLDLAQSADAAVARGNVLREHFSRQAGLDKHEVIVSVADWAAP